MDRWFTKLHPYTLDESSSITYDYFLFLDEKRKFRLSPECVRYFDVCGDNVKEIYEDIAKSPLFFF